MANRKSKIDITNLSEEKLLDQRICDLDLRIDGTWLAECVDTLYAELLEKGIKFRPPCYLADEWLTPDQEPIVGIPFFLAHPNLMKLERKMMLEVEGGTRNWCMKLLRHETGHAINYAYKLYRRKRWQKIFGPFSKEYGDTYRFRPYSKNYVRHLEDYYAQYHPDEDFSETFAVWLTPGINWQDQYKGWKAINKLRYVDEVINEIKDKEPLVKKGDLYWQASRIRVTLKNFYKRKQHSYAEELPDFHDTNLKKIFDALAPEQLNISKKNKDFQLAANLIRKYKKDILNNVAKWSGEKKYIIAKLIEALIKRCKALKLTTEKSESLVVLEVVSYITTLVMNYQYTGGFRKN